ncbi:MAG: methionine--tRNA ligase [Candidatus Paceibacterota bacterium]
MNKPFYITTTLPYVNAEPHIGFAMELIRADIIARTRVIAGQEVFFNTGTDEHGLKIYQKAREHGLDPQTYCDQISAKFRELLPTLGVMPEANFIRTTDPHHIAAAQAFWEIVDNNGFIYKKNYSIKYCVGCELEKTDSELVDGRCPLHPLQQVEVIQEENYFFKFSAFQQKLLDLYASRPDFVVPDFRFNEIKAFVSRGLEDFSISRLKEKMPWGVAVPGDESQVMYVWFDALVNYISAIGWPARPADFKKWHVETGGMIQYCGKDNIRQQSAMWQAMLMAAGLPPSKTIVINGFITGEGGVKMSKSLGNTVNPLEIVKEYGTDALRYYVAREIHPFEDSPFTMDMFKQAYNAHLANGVGNLVSRVMKMATDNLDSPVKVSNGELPEDFRNALDLYNIQAASNLIWKQVAEADQIIQSKEPFKLIKTDKKAAQEIIIDLCVRLDLIGRMLAPIMPETSKIIGNLVGGNKMPEKPLFIRK